MNHENTDKLSLDTVFTMSPGGCYENCFLGTFHELAHGLIRHLQKSRGDHLSCRTNSYSCCNWILPFQTRGRVIRHGKGMLPGLIGSIASLIFNTAAKAVEFVAKNAWLLIVALLVFVVEWYKNKKR